MAMAFLWLGYALCFSGGLWIVVLAWQKGIVWGMGCLFFPILQLIFVALEVLNIVDEDMPGRSAFQ